MKWPKYSPEVGFYTPQIATTYTLVRPTPQVPADCLRQPLNLSVGLQVAIAGLIKFHLFGERKSYGQQSYP
jgi:hypothetical protein